MIKLLVLDVDGTMTDGKVYFVEDNEAKAFNIKDGLAITTWHKLGFKTAIITGRKSNIVSKRADELGINYVYQGIRNKIDILNKIIQQEQISFDEVAVIGDDLNDVSMMQKAKLSFAPVDANKYILEYIDILLQTKGGEGAVKEMIEYIIEKYDLKKRYISVWV